MRLKNILIVVKDIEKSRKRCIKHWLENLHKQLIESPNISDENTACEFTQSKDGKK